MRRERNDLDDVMEAVRHRGITERITRKDLRDIIHQTFGCAPYGETGDRIEQELLEKRRLTVINQHAYRVMPEGQVFLEDYS